MGCREDMIAYAEKQQAATVDKARDAVTVFLVKAFGAFVTAMMLVILAGIMGSVIALLVFLL